MKHDLTRRRFLHLGAAVGLSAVRGATSMANEQHPASTEREQADVIVRNGRIATQDDRRSIGHPVGFCSTASGQQMWVGGGVAGVPVLVGTTTRG